MPESMRKIIQTYFEKNPESSGYGQVYGRIGRNKNAHSTGAHFLSEGF
jgi:hypothetical protein